MQFTSARRTAKTYGKANRNLFVHDIFEYRAHNDEASDTASPKISSHAQKQRLQSELVEDERMKHGNVLESSRPGRANASISGASNERTNTKSVKPNIEDSTLFDLDSSDDGNSSSTSGSRASKRRRITQPLKQKKVQDEDGPAVPKAKETQSLVKRPKTEQNTSPKIPIKSLSRKKPILSESAQAAATNGKSTNTQKKPSQRSITKPTPLPRIKKSKISASPLEHTSENNRTVEQSTTDVSGNLSDHPHYSDIQTTTIPKRKRLSPPGTGSEVSSPGHLGMAELELASTNSNPATLVPEPSSDENDTRRKPRRRLIDRLDAPSQSMDEASEGIAMETLATSSDVKSQGSAKTRNNQSKDVVKKRQLTSAKLAGEEPTSTQNQSAWTSRPKTTYATQRSHLSDMVDGLDNIDAPSSQKSIEELILPVPVSHLASQLELEEEESDDQMATARLKSIHELRQAGANNRFDREVDALLEDITLTERSAQALRLQALMKLVTKLREPSFRRHLATSGRTLRLISTAKPSLNIPLAILLTRAFWSLAQAEEINLDTIRRLFKAALSLAPDMLQDHRPLSKVAKDKKHNISRALVRDLAEFEELNAEEQDTNSTSSRLCADKTAIQCLELTLRGMVQLGDTSAKVNTTVYAQVLRVLKSEIQHIQDDAQALIDIGKVEIVLSLLELCSVVEDDTYLRIGDKEYEELGSSLASIVLGASDLYDSLRRGALRVVVSLSNNNARMCRLLGHTDISKAAFGIIHDNFLQLAKQADNEQELDQDKFDLVVLALGCLLNFAECDPTLRKRLSRMEPGSDNYITRLVFIFNFQVLKVDEAMTKEQSQVSVAFGYLCMLLCTLSLQASIRDQVTQSLKGKSFEELCAAAEKFFSHLRTLENISEDDASMSTFTARFGAILQTIRSTDA